jgi:hypothetical protein
MARLSKTFSAAQSSDLGASDFEDSALSIRRSLETESERQPFDLNWRACVELPTPSLA